MVTKLHKHTDKQTNTHTTIEHTRTHTQTDSPLHSINVLCIKYTHTNQCVQQT